MVSSWPLSWGECGQASVSLCSGSRWPSRICRAPLGCTPAWKAQARPRPGPGRSRPVSSSPHQLWHCTASVHGPAFPGPDFRSATDLPVGLRKHHLEPSHASEVGELPCLGILWEADTGSGSETRHSHRPSSGIGWDTTQPERPPVASLWQEEPRKQLPRAEPGAAGSTAPALPPKATVRMSRSSSRMRGDRRTQAGVFARSPFREKTSSRAPVRTRGIAQPGRPFSVCCWEGL